MTRSLSQTAAVASVSLLAALVPLVPLGLSIGPFDVVTGLMPVALLASLPFLAERRADTKPKVGFGLAVPAAAFLVAGLLSVIANPIGIEPLLTLARYAAYIALAVVVGMVTRDDWARLTVMWTLAASGSAAVAYSFYQFIRPTKSIGMSELEGYATTRVFSTFDNPNFYGEFLVILIPVLIGLAAVSRGRWRLVAATCATAAFGSLLLTYTRGSWLALAVGLLVAMHLARMRYRWLAVASCAVAVAAVPGALARVASIFSLAGTASFRLRLWRIAGEVIADNPYFGVGIGRFYDGFRETVIARPDLAIGYLEYGAHNSLLTIAAETGLVGGLAFGWLLFDVLRRGLVVAESRLDRGRDIENAVYTGALLAFVLNALTSNAFQHPKGAVFFWLVAGLHFGVQASAAPRREEGGIAAEAALAGSSLHRLYRRVQLESSATLRHARVVTLMRAVFAMLDASAAARIVGWMAARWNDAPAETHPMLWSSLTNRASRRVGDSFESMWRCSLVRSVLYAPAPSASELLGSSATARSGRFLRSVLARRRSDA